jgi:hypothetical protein
MPGLSLIVADTFNSRVVVLPSRVELGIKQFRRQGEARDDWERWLLFVSPGGGAQAEKYVSVPEQRAHWQSKVNRQAKEVHGLLSANRI